MDTSIELTLAFLTGIVLGIIFFGGLWLTIRWAMNSKNPGIWFLLSMLSRTAIVVVGIFVITHGEIGEVLLCMAGFILTRIFLSRRLDLSTYKQNANTGGD